MFELILCSIFTVLPDYLVRRYVQGKTWGNELTLFSVWYELRWGLTACLILTVSLITIVFYYHPATSNVSSLFRTVSILPEEGGRVAEVFVENEQEVSAGDRLFRLEDSTQRASVETAKRRIEEVSAAFELADSELAAADGAIGQAEGALEQIEDELARKRPLAAEGSAIVSEKEIERLENALAQRTGALDAAIANRQAVESKISVLLPAQKATAEAALEQAEAELAKTVIYAGVGGIIDQFALQVGDFVSPLLRPAGILIPEDPGRGRFFAAFGQISAQVLHVGMLAEITCASKPFTVVPMVVTGVQDVIPAGQFRPTDQLIDLQDRGRPGTIMVWLEPLYPGQTDDLPPGSKCIANAYTSNHDKLDDDRLSAGTWLFYHMVDTVGLVHAIILRLQAMFLPVQTLVFAGH
ncbi:MAG: biotin/lipoyl-binding protein [Pseudomonadota bacterium]